MYKKIKKVLTFIMALSIIVSSSIFMSEPAHAEKIGGKWDDTIKINMSSDWPYYSEFENAVDEWNDVFSDNDYTTRIKLGRFRDPNVSVEWAKPGTGNLGLTEMGPDPYSGTYSYGFMYFKESSVENLSPSQRKSLFVHELGHLLGLDHTSKSKDSIMWGKDWAFMKFTSPQRFDIDEVLDIYYNDRIVY